MIWPHENLFRQILPIHKLPVACIIEQKNKGLLQSVAEMRTKQILKLGVAGTFAPHCMYVYFSSKIK